MASSLLYTIAVPYAALTTAYLYPDLRVRERLEPVRRDDADALARGPRSGP